MLIEQFKGGLFLSVFSVIDPPNLDDTSDTRSVICSKAYHAMEYFDKTGER